MDFLKGILGDELYAQVEAKVNAYNATETNKDKAIKIANLGTGEYVSADKYKGLEGTLASKAAELEAANGTIADFKKTEKGNELLQGKIVEYESTVAKLQDELINAQKEAAIKVALLEAKATDTDYLTYKLKENNPELVLDENGKVKGLDKEIEGLKIKYPTQFEAGATKMVKENQLPKTENKEGMSKKDLLKKSYAERNQFQQENPEIYNELMNK